MNSAVEALLTKADRSLQAARLLLNDGYCDFAVSRAYYGMFYAAEAALLSIGLTYSSHSAVIAAFGKEFSKTGILAPELHRALKDAFDQRDVADYDTASEITAESSNTLLAQAEQFLQAVRDYLSSNPTAD